MKKVYLIVFVMMFFSIILVTLAPAEDSIMTKQGKEESLSFIVPTPEDGFQLSIALSRKGVTETQPDKEVLKKLRPAYAHDPDSLIAAFQVIAFISRPLPLSIITGATGNKPDFKTWCTQTWSQGLNCE